MGRGGDEEALRRLADELGVGSRVDFHGFKRDRAEIRELVRRAGVFSLASAREGLPIALLEAMSTATPVVCSDIPAMAEVVSDGRDGRVVGLGRPDQLAEAIAYSHEHRDRLGPAARRDD